ncbi:hypothetical protein [Occultella aeris]|uniref:hypothetical protein n=1 Tax=Occultella aeris TaxID=2761496 RepID=UPI0012EA0080|nr:hypothetical protein [Occultella aeris]
MTSRQLQTQGSTGDQQHAVLESAALSCTLWRNPTDHDDPANLADLSDGARIALNSDPAGPLPDWLLRLRERLRYPLLWEAVRTTHISDHSLAGWHTPASELVDHTNYILTNTFRDTRNSGWGPHSTVRDPATENALTLDVPIRVDGRDVQGLRLDGDPDVVGLAASLGDRILTAVLAREHKPFLRLAFATRPDRAPG